jgi:hypothetical protein
VARFSEMVMRLQLSANQIDMIHSAAAPLPRWDQTLFMHRVAELLREEPELGDGVVHRVVRIVQQQFWQPPLKT